ncbi:fasciclin domain-containing protein [Streptosporangium sp. NPDC000396]|uniref:fasciclin domain-containing protein n=1 Tax=Streptosporangium sp. NPDC000396 TaxID=3366185 RepID=UPI0036965CC2
MKKKPLLASALAALILTAVPAAQAATTSSLPGLSPTPVPTDMTSPEPSDMISASPSEGMGEPIGSGCASLPNQGKGLEDRPIASALADIPALEPLVKALQESQLAETLNSAKEITVFAPTREAFAKVPKETLTKLMGDRAQLKEILTYHVVPKKVTPTDLEAGMLETLQGGKLTVKEENGEYMVNDAKVVCGNIPTKNATVYIIDSVLMPQAEASPTSEVSPS